MTSAGDPPATMPESLTIPQALELALQLHKAGHLDTAETIYERVLTAVPEHPDALHFLGMARFKRGDRDRAIDLVTRALAVAPDSADARNNLGNMLLEVGRLDEAEAAYQQVLALRPQHADAQANIGICRRRKKDLPGAEAALRAAIALDPDHGAAYHNLASVLQDLERPLEALSAYQRSLELRPYDGDSYRLVGTMLNVLGRTAEAAAIYRRWLSLEPDNARAQHYLAAATGEAVPARASDDYVAKTFDNFAVTFDEVLERLDYRAPTLIADALAPVIGAPAAALDVLDAGAGTGWCGPLLRPYARTLVGVDLSPAMLDKAKARAVYDRLEVGELTAFMQAHPGAFDVIVSADTLVYFGDLGAALDAAARALRAGGTLAFTIEHALDDPPEGYRLNPHGRYSHAQSHVERALAAAGLAPLNIARAHLRTERQIPVDGLLITARRSES